MRVLQLFFLLLLLVNAVAVVTANNCGDYCSYSRQVAHVVSAYETVSTGTVTGYGVGSFSVTIEVHDEAYPFSITTSVPIFMLDYSRTGYPSIAEYNFPAWGTLWLNNQRIGTVAITNTDSYTKIIFSYNSDVAFNVSGVKVFQIRDFAVPQQYYELYPNYTVRLGIKIGSDYTLSGTALKKLALGSSGIRAGNVTHVYMVKYEYNYTLSYSKLAREMLFIVNNKISSTTAVVANYGGKDYLIYPNNTIYISVNDLQNVNIFTPGKTQLLETINLQETANKLCCLQAFKVDVLSASNIRIPAKLVVEGREYVAENGSVVITDYRLAGRTVNVTVYPLYQTVFARNVTVSFYTDNVTIRLADFYSYLVTLKAYYKPWLGDQVPVGFTYAISGLAYPDKNQSRNVSWAIGGSANGKVTIHVPAGNYTLNVSSSIMGIQKTASRAITLLDNNYLREYTWVFTPEAPGEIQETVAQKAYLTVYVVDQNNRSVVNATIRVYNPDYEQYANTNRLGIAQFELMPNSYYVLEIYYKNSLRKVDELFIDSINTVKVYQITLNEQELREQEEMKAVPPVTPQPPEQQQQQIVTTVVSLLTNTAVIALILVIAMGIIAAQYGGERMGLIAFIAGIGVFTLIIPWLPMALFTVIAIIGALLFGWKVTQYIFRTEE